MTPEEFRALREAAGLTQGQLAARLGLTREAVNRLEAGGTIKPIHEYALRWVAQEAAINTP